jgi:hypothetical protein
MERLNLPTLYMQREAGLSPMDWANKVLMFHRADAGNFVVTAVEPDSDSAEAWGAESASEGRIYRLGNNSDRLCGLI